MGKSTLARILAERLNAQRVMEPDSNPFLDSFYEGERGAAFQAQFTFLVRRFEQLQALDLGPRSQKTVVSDFIFEKDKLFACLNLTDQELDTYNRYYNHFREQLPTPDLVIYLQATSDVLKKRLKKKNAPAERAVSDEYLAEVIKAYEHFFFHYTSSDLLIVNTSDIDFVDRNEDLQELLRKVTEPIKGTQYFLPLGGQDASGRLEEIDQDFRPRLPPQTSKTRQPNIRSWNRSSGSFGQRYRRVTIPKFMDARQRLKI